MNDSTTLMKYVLASMGGLPTTSMIGSGAIKSPHEMFHTREGIHILPPCKQEVTRGFLALSLMISDGI